MTNIDYTLWPNADGELGKIKVAIPTNAEDWPAGDALIGNFVYNDGKLAGFVDTKALILNENATTTFPYDYVDISLPSIQEGTLTVNRGERCKYLNVKFYNHEWLPPGFTELEYMESSGTQFIDTGIVTDGTYTITARLRGNNLVGTNDIWGRRGANGDSFAQRYKATYWLIAFYYVWGGQLSEPQIDSAQAHDYIVTEGQKRIIVDGKSFNLNALNLREVNASNPNSKTHYLFSANGGTKGQVCFYSFRMIDGVGNLVLDFVPVLNADGVPGMYDKVSKQFFDNDGTGTFGYRIKTASDSSAPLSLRDPYYVAPSGVYAKLVAENELEIIADTEEVQGDDWVHFANTGEAYEHFGITFEDETLVS